MTHFQLDSNSLITTCQMASHIIPTKWHRHDIFFSILYYYSPGVSTRLGRGMRSAECSLVTIMFAVCAWTISHLVQVIEVFPQRRSKLFDDDKHGKPESTEMRELVFVDPEFLREQESDESNSKNVRTYSDFYNISHAVCHVWLVFSPFDARNGTFSSKNCLKKQQNKIPKNQNVWC